MVKRGHIWLECKFIELRWCEDEAEAERIRLRIVLANLPLARWASAYCHSWEGKRIFGNKKAAKIEDIATNALIDAVQEYDYTAEESFQAFAVKKIVAAFVKAGIEKCKGPDLRQSKHR
ncbi:MAG: hypothetical protein WC858_01150 [Parcubacteria group bacterium]|jgi:DNA-directed RNA polymerase specialized sigma subunit